MKFVQWTLAVIGTIALVVVAAGFFLPSGFAVQAFDRDRGRAQEGLRPHRRAEALEGLERVDASRSRHADHVFGPSFGMGATVVVGEQERKAAA